MLGDIENAARKALLTVEPAGSRVNAHSTIMQSETETYGAFFDRLTQAVERQCPDEQAHPYILRSLAFTNANDECKKVILALPNQPPTIPQMLSACSKLNTPQHLAQLQANALGEQIEKSQDLLEEKLGEKLERVLEAQPKVIEKNFAAEQVDSAKGACFNSGKPGYMKKDCPTTATQTKSSDV